MSADDQKAPRKGLNRREALQRAGILGAGAMLSGAMNAAPSWADVLSRATAVKAAGSGYEEIEHFVFLMMENRSYDHYFGAYPKGRGFDDHPKKSLGVFEQEFPASAGGSKVVPKNKLLPFHLDSSKGFACTDDLNHDFGPMHDCWNDGKMDKWVVTHTQEYLEGERGATTMGYYNRDDIPFYWALADHYTLLDGYHSSIIGPTHPNRMMQMTGTVDPAGTHGGPILATLGVTSENSEWDQWACNWQTMPEVLENAGVSWKIYTPDGGPGLSAASSAVYPWLSAAEFSTWEATNFEPGATPGLLPLSDNVLPYFTNFQGSGTGTSFVPNNADLYSKAFEQTFPGQFAADLAAGDFPSVSWVIPPLGFDEHPAASPRNGEFFTNLILDQITKYPEVWAKTAVFLMYDENDGWFDHVAPPTAPKGTTGEYVTAKYKSGDTMQYSVDGATYDDALDTWNKPGGTVYSGPLGLGVRVPALMISPFSAGGKVVSEVFDHTSQLQLIAKRFNVPLPTTGGAVNVSAWRRKKVGDLTSCFQTKADTKLPSLPKTAVYLPADGICAAGLQEVDWNGASVVGDDIAPVGKYPKKQRMPNQKGGTDPISDYHELTREEHAVPDDEYIEIRGEGTATTKSANNQIFADAVANARKAAS